MIDFGNNSRKEIAIEAKKKTGLNVIKFIYYKLSYIQDLAGQRAFMALVQSIPFGLAGLGNFLHLVY